MYVCMYVCTCMYVTQGEHFVRYLEEAEALYGPLTEEVEEIGSPMDEGREGNHATSQQRHYKRSQR